MLKYSLRENLLTPAPDDYMAQVADVRSYTLDEIIDLMMDKGTTLTRADVAATLQVYGEVCSSLIKDGAALNTPLMNTALSISGVFNGANDIFDKKRHTVNLNITAGILLRDVLPKIKCEKTEGASTDPYITEVTDIVTGTVNTTLTKGGVVQLVGSRLKFDAKDAAQGIFFVPETGEAVRAAVIAENKPARLMAIIPADLLNRLRLYRKVRVRNFKLYGYIAPYNMGAQTRKSWVHKPVNRGCIAPHNMGT